MRNKYCKSLTFFVLMGSLALAFFSFNFSYCRASVSDEFEKQVQIVAEPSWGGDPDTLGSLVYTIVNAFLGLLGIIFLILIIYAGYNWMTAQGEEEKVTKAKDTLTRAVIGLIIIILAYSITYFVFTHLPGGEGVGGGGSESL